MKKKYLLALPLVLMLLFVPMATRISNPSQESFGGVIFLVKISPVTFCIVIASILTIFVFFDGSKILWIGSLLACGISVFLFLPLSMYMLLPFGIMVYLYKKYSKREVKI